MKVLIGLASMKLFKDYYNLDPGVTQILGSIIVAPWSLKILYGLLADNFTIFGSKRKSYIIIMSLIQAASMTQVALYRGKNYKYVTACLVIQSISSAYTNVVADAMLVYQARKNLLEGSSNLQSFAWSCLAIGGVCGAITAAFVTQYCQPQNAFYGSAITSVVISFFAFRLNDAVERNDEEEPEGGARWISASGGMCNSIRLLGASLKNRELRNMMLYVICSKLVVPKFSGFTYFFVTGTLGIS